VPQLLGWPAARLAPEVRKSLEVALHAGSAAALVLVLRRESRPRGAGELVLALASAAPAALAALVLERPIERRLGTERTVALAQLGGGVALLAADRVIGAAGRAPGARPLAGPAGGLPRGARRHPVDAAIRALARGENRAYSGAR